MEFFPHTLIHYIRKITYQGTIDYMKSPEISIIIPVYNASGTIGTIVRGITSQTFQNFELILVDDGSTDSTLKVLRGLTTKDKRIVIRSIKNGGPSAARNSGLAKARGKYVIFFDADDSITPNLLQVMHSAISKRNSDIAVAGWNVSVKRNQSIVKHYKIINPPTRFIAGKNSINRFMIKSIGDDGLMYNLWNKIYRLDIINQNNLRFREDLRFGEDLVFILHYLKYSNKLQIISDALYDYQADSDSSIFKLSALEPKYRIVNADELDKFIGKTPTREILELANWVKWRWLLSYYRLVAGSDLTYQRKIQLIKDNQSLDAQASSSTKYIGKKRFSLQLVTSICYRHPTIALAFGKLFHYTKILIMKLRLIKA